MDNEYITNRITEYLSNGGLFNPESMNHEEVRNLLMEIREYLMQIDFGVEDASIEVGSRIKVISGFNVGAKGTVNYIEPTGRMWVRRDGASSDVFYHPEEVKLVE